MMKEIKNYLHLYLGCEVSLPNGDKYILKPSNLPNNFRDLPKPINGKPILRQIDSMTQDERIEVRKLSELSFTFSGGAEVTNYLLSKYFDLFGLIPSGLAVDKTIIK